jgi:hypothetical protein
MSLSPEQIETASSALFEVKKTVFNLIHQPNNTLKWTWKQPMPSKSGWWNINSSLGARSNAGKSTFGGPKLSA